MHLLNRNRLLLLSLSFLWRHSSYFGSVCVMFLSKTGIKEGTTTYQHSQELKKKQRVSGTDPKYLHWAVSWSFKVSLSNQLWFCSEDSLKHIPTGVENTNSVVYKQIFPKRKEWFDILLISGGNCFTLIEP